MARSRKNIIFLTETELIAVNEEMVSKYGGLHGVGDLGLLESAAGRPQMSVGFQDAYPTIFDKAACLLHSIVNNHPFLDGNKRTSLFGAVLFLESNGFRVELKRKEAVKFIKKVHDNKLPVSDISHWLENHCVKRR